MSDDKKSDAGDSKSGGLTDEEQYARQFLLSQHTEMNEDWRHLNHRIETAINLYIGVWALLGSAASVLYTDLEDVSIFLQIVGLLVLFILAAFGFFTARRITSATILRERKRLSANLIKLFFQERTPEIKDYLPVYIKTPTPLEGDSDKKRKESEGQQLVVSFPDGIVYFIYFLNSLLAGVLSTAISLPILFEADRWVFFVLGFEGAILFQHFYYVERKSNFNLKRK